MSDPLLAALRAIVGASNLLTGEAMASRLSDWRGRYHGAARAVVLPGNTAEVAAVVRACAAASVPMVPQGGNTGLVGGATPDADGRAVVIVLTRMNRVLAVDPVNNTLTAEAGCLLADAQAAALGVDRLFPLSLASEGSCTIGGNIATNAGGVHVLRYGMMREQVLGLEAVLPDGEVWDGLRALRKDNTGYDLKQLFIGAEGTLGIVTRAVLKLAPRPTAHATAWLAIDAIAASVEIFCKLQQRLGARLCAFEILGRNALNVLFRQFPGVRDPFPGTAWAVLVQVEDGGDDATLMAALEDAVAAEHHSGRLRDAVIARSLREAEQLWWLREHTPEAEKREGVSVKHDIALPISSLAEFVTAAEAALQDAFPGVEVLCFGHLGDGNLHYNVRHRDPTANASLLQQQSEVNRVVYNVVAGFGGSISAEHGIGQLKRDVLPRYRPSLEMRVMQEIKRAIDPQGLMNPGRVLGAID